MSATRLDNSLINSSDWSNEITVFDLLTKGLHPFDFNNWTGNSELTVKAGSAIESNETVYVFDDEATISGDLSSYVGIVFVRTSPTGLVYDTTITELPEWDPKRRGYYDLSDNRVLASFNYELGVYSSKKLYLDEYDPDIELENSSGEIYINAQLVITSDWQNIKIGAYTYGIGHARGETTNTVYIFRTADNKNYEKLFEDSGADYVSDWIYYVNGKILAVYEKHDSGNNTIYYPVVSENLTSFADPGWGINSNYTYYGLFYTNGIWLMWHYHRATSSFYFSKSIDFQNWTSYQPPQFDHINDITTYKNLFVETCGYTSLTEKFIYYSLDGNNWFKATINAVVTLKTGVNFSEIDGLLYAIGDVSLSSTDGMTFNEVVI